MSYQFASLKALHRRTLYNDLMQSLSRETIKKHAPLHKYECLKYNHSISCKKDRRLENVATIAC